MAEKLTFRYDRVGDILYIEKCPPYAEQESEELGDDIIARLNPTSGDIENLEILFFSKRLLDERFNGNLLELPVIANLQIAG
jgi:uncharacterized protein YuzE